MNYGPANNYSEINLFQTLSHVDRVESLNQSADFCELKEILKSEIEKRMKYSKYTAFDNTWYTIVEQFYFSSCILRNMKFYKF